MIARIDSVLLEHRKSDEHRFFVERWLDEQGKQAYREAYGGAFSSVSSGPEVSSEGP